jgi:hypothetical protein
MAEGTPVDPTRGHQNNLEHARAVYLSALFRTPKEMWLDAVEKLHHEVTDRLEKK